MACDVSPVAMFDDNDDNDDNDDTVGLDISARCDAMLEEEEPRTMLKVISDH